uniref:Uncharacterized protein n=1 Tax=Opuntia streptacantha TaxID=393608 RepID=A0A7C9E5X7_OPUST
MYLFTDNLASASSFTNLEFTISSLCRFFLSLLRSALTSSIIAWTFSCSLARHAALSSLSFFKNCSSFFFEDLLSDSSSSTRARACFSSASSAATAEAAFFLWSTNFESSEFSFIA